MPSIGKRLVNAAQKARGRRALRYEIEVIPSFVGDIPDGIQKVLFCWSRGQKLYITDAVNVSSKTRAAFFRQYLRQETTIYMEANEVIPKEFTFKIQTPGAKEDDRHTIGKVKIDLAQFCDGQDNPEPQEVSLQCKPVGKMKVSIKARWLKDAKVDPDAMTEMTEMTDIAEGSMPSVSKRSKSRQKKYADSVDEQDLSGFDNLGDVPEDGQPGQGGADSQRRGKKKGRRRRQIEEEIPEGLEVPVDADQPDGQAPADPGDLVQGTQLRKQGWRDYLCCCLEKPQVFEGEGDDIVAAQEVATLLDDQQATAMDMHNDSTPVEHRKPRRKQQSEPQLPPVQPPGGARGRSTLY